VILLYLTHTEAELLERLCIHPDLRRKLHEQIAADILPYDCAAKTVIWRDEGDGLRMVGVSYDDDHAADAAFDALYRRLQHEPEPAPVKKRKRKKAA
jgi:hypothetical protein